MRAVRGSARRWTRWAAIVAAGVVGVSAGGVAIAVSAGAAQAYTVASGSMAPAVRVGDLVLTRPIAAGAVEIGDIVTVPAQGGAWVTHRVVDVLAAEGATRGLVLRGDANDAVDPRPYVADRVQVMVAAVPQTGAALAWMREGSRGLWVAVFVAGVVLAVAVLTPRPGARASRHAASSTSDQGSPS